MLSPLTKALFALLIAGGMAACDVTPLRSMWALRSVDPMTTAPEAISLAIRVPQGFRPSPNGITLVGTLKASDTEPAETTTFIIERHSGNGLPSWMRRAGAPLYSYKIADADIERFRHFQDKARRAKASKRGGDITIGTEVCRLSETIPSQVLVSAFIKAAEVDDYVPLFEDKDILEEAATAQIAEIAPLCV